MSQHLPCLCSANFSAKGLQSTSPTALNLPSSNHPCISQSPDPLLSQSRKDEPVDENKGSDFGVGSAKDLVRDRAAVGELLEEGEDEIRVEGSGGHC